MRRGSRRFALAFLAPAFLLYTFFVVVPLLMSIATGFSNWRLGRDPAFNGLDNWVRLLSDGRYWTVFRNSFVMVGAALVIQIPLALCLSWMLYWTVRGFRFFRSAYFVPVVVAPVAVGLLFSLLLNGDIGPVNSVLGGLGLHALQHSWLSDIHLVLYSVIAPNVWQYVGFYVVILLAGMRGIPADYLDAASLDGASRSRMLTSIVIPSLREIIVICMILAITGAIRAFDHAWVMTQGGPGVASSFFSVLVFKSAFIDYQLGYASAIATTVLVYSLVITVVMRRFLSRDVERMP